MRMRAGLLAISLGLGCGVLATETTRKTEARTTPSNQDEPVATWGHVEGSIEGKLESAGEENRVFFVPFGNRSPSMEEMRKRLADPEQRKAMRAEQRTSLEQNYPDVGEALNLDSTTHEALMQLLTDHSMESMDRLVSDYRGNAMPSMQSMAGVENKKLDQLREVLGEDGLERFQEYTTTVHERSQVRDVNAHLGANDKLSPEQQARLVKLFKERNQLPPPTPSRMSNILRGRDPGSPTFREDMQRESELATIESNEEVLRFRETSIHRMAERAAEFLSPAQSAALAKVNDADQARQRKWLEKARAKAGLDPGIPERKDEESDPSRKPVPGEVTLDLVVRVNDGDPVHITHTGSNGEPLKFKASEDLFAEAEWTLFEDNWIDVRLTFYEEGPNGRRRLQGGAGFGTLGDNSIGARSNSSTIVMGRKAYSIELSATAAAR